MSRGTKRSLPCLLAVALLLLVAGGADAQVMCQGNSHFDATCGGALDPTPVVFGPKAIDQREQGPYRYASVLPEIPARYRVRLGETATRKLMWENASRFFRLTSTPWSAP